MLRSRQRPAALRHGLLNIVAQKGGPVALVDREFAGSAGALWGLAEAVRLNDQLHHDNIAEGFGLPMSNAGRAKPG